MEKDSLSCKNPSQHEDKWLLIANNEKNGMLACFACCAMSLEDKQELGLRKRMILSYFRDLMESNAYILINIISSDDQVLVHTVHLFLNLLNSDDERLLKLSGECLLLFLIHVKKEGLGLVVMQRLTIEIEENNNYSKSLQHFYVLGRLFQVFPELVRMSICYKYKFSQMLANGLTYPSDEVKIAISFLLRQIIQNVENSKSTSSTLEAVFVTRTLKIIKLSQNKDLIRSALGLLKLLICKVLQNFNVLFETSSEDASFTGVIKKILLSNEYNFQISIVQSICQLLNNPLFEKQIILLLKDNIPEVLFDVLSTKNELLLESVICCLHLFVKHAEVAVKSRFVFGAGIIIDVCCSMLMLKNWKLLCTALNLLTSIITSNEYLLTSSNMTFYYQSVQFTERAFKVHNPIVLLALSKYFNEFLKNKDLPWTVPLEHIHENVDLCLKNLTKFVSSLTMSEEMKKCVGVSNSLSIEMQLLISGLDMISSCISLYKQYISNPVSVEKGFSCPSILSTSKSTCLQTEKSWHLMLLCLSALDEIFVPCCLKLKSSDVGGIAWHHLIKVLVVLYEEIENVLVYQFAKKLIRAGFFKHLFDIKASKVFLVEWTTEQIKQICNRSVKGVLKCILKAKTESDEYLAILEKGIGDLNNSLDECVSVLSQKRDVNNEESIEFWALPSQTAFLCLCYLSYLNEAFVVNTKILIPHLIYFVTCNSDLLSTCSIILKHLIFLMAVCSYECMNRNLKCQTGLTEANMITWELLSKLKTPLEVYTHHKYMLWWCFRNQACNSFSSEVLLRWIIFCVDEKQSLRHHAIKTVVSLLYSCNNAQQTFVLLFDIFSSSHNDVVIKFLKEVNELEDSKKISEGKLQNLIILMINYLHSLLVKIFTMKNENDKGLDKVLCQGLECLLWCHEQIDHVEIDGKIFFHISKYCFFADSKTIETIIACLKFLRFTLKHNQHFEKAWYIMTGDFNFSTFFHKCFASHSQLEVEALSFLIDLFNCQLNYNLKCSICIQIHPEQLLKWLSSLKCQSLAFQLLHLIIKAEFQIGLFVYIPLKCDENALQNKHLYFRLLSLYLQNTIVSENPLNLDENLDSYLNLLNIISETDKNLESHLMMQPWIKILMESRLNKLDAVTWKLLEKWLSFNKVNSSLTEVMQLFANKLQSINPLTEIEKTCIKKFCTGVYSNFVSEETRRALKELSSYTCDTAVEEMDLLTQVQNIVTSCVSNKV